MSGMIDFLKDNFFHIAPIILTGLFGLAVILERTKALLWSYPVRNGIQLFESIADLVLSNKISEAIALSERYANKPVGVVIKEALIRADQPDAIIRNGLEIIVTEMTQKIQKRTHYLATIANVATLLGLLGTIVGLIHAFEALGALSAQQKATFLAAGISTAMNATLMGLVVAVPCMIAYSFLTSATNALNADIENSASRMVDILSRRYFQAEMSLKGARRQ